MEFIIANISTAYVGEAKTIKDPQYWSHASGLHRWPVEFLTHKQTNTENVRHIMPSSWGSHAHKHWSWLIKERENGIDGPMQLMPDTFVIYFSHYWIDSDFVCYWWDITTPSLDLDF